MRGSNAWRAVTRTLALGALAGGSTACAANPAPSGWLAPARKAPSDPYGAWVGITTHDGGADYRGELLGIERDSVFVLVYESTPSSIRLQRGEVAAVPVRGVRHARLAFFDAQWYRSAAYTGALAVASISHGYYMVLTVPTALIVGSLATAAQARAPIVDVNNMLEWDAARMYARFPSRLPDPLPRTLPIRGSR